MFSKKIVTGYVFIVTCHDKNQKYRDLSRYFQKNRDRSRYFQINRDLSRYCVCTLALHSVQNIQAINFKVYV